MNPQKSFNFGCRRECGVSRSTEEEKEVDNGKEVDVKNGGSDGEINVKGQFTFNVQGEEVTYTGKAEIETKGFENFKRGSTDTSKMKEVFLKKIGLFLDRLDKSSTFSLTNGGTNSSEIQSNNLETSSAENRPQKSTFHQEQVHKLSFGQPQQTSSEKTTFGYSSNN